MRRRPRRGPARTRMRDAGAAPPRSPADAADRRTLQPARPAGPRGLARRARGRARVRPRRGIGPPAPGVRLPPVLGGQRRRDQARLRRALDDRLLLGRRERQGRPQEAGRRRHAARPAGAAGRARHDPRDQRGPRQRHPRRPHRHACSPGRRARRASRRRSSAAARRAATSPARSSAAVRDRGADGVNLDFEPLASGYADEFVSLLRDDPERAQPGPVRLPAHVRHDRLHRQLPARGVGRAAGAADAIFVMGYDYRIGSSSTAGSIDPLSGPATTSPTRSAPTSARVARLAADPRPPVVRPRLVDGDRRPPRSRTLSGAKYGYSTRGELRERRRPRRAARPALGRGRAEPVRRLPAPELHRRPTAASPAGARSTTTTRPR